MQLSAPPIEDAEDNPASVLNNLHIFVQALERTGDFESARAEIGCDDLDDLYAMIEAAREVASTVWPSEGK